MIVIDAFAIGSILLAIYHPHLVLILVALFAALMAIGFALVAIENRRLGRWSRREEARRAKIWRIIEEDKARP